MKRCVLLLLALFAIGKFCHKQTDGFTLAKISQTLLEKGGSEVDPNLLQTPYRYLTKGGQSYVFASDDGRYILKFFRNSRLANLQLLQHLLPLSSIKKKIQMQEKELFETLQSFAIAQKHLKEETGLIATHLDGQIPLSAPLTIIDKLGIAHKMDANRYPFIIQERVTLVKDRIDELMHAGQVEQAHVAIASLFALVQKRIEKKIEDQDPNLSKNFGFCQNHAIQIDAGRFSFSDAPKRERSMFLTALLVSSL